MIIKQLSKFLISAALSCSVIFCTTLSYQAIAEENIQNPESNTIASEIEQIKKEVLKLNRELFILEEDLLFPASTQVAVFVSVDIGRFFTLDSVELKLNDDEVAGFLYTKRQRESLEQGGIQRLFKGNLKTGQHELTAIFIGLDQEKRTVKRAVTYQFEKEDDAVMIELKLEDNTRNFQTEVIVEEWIL
ncbi:AraC family transcriptional regulator [Colwellia sp. RE-S-Sl-9]